MSDNNTSRSASDEQPSNVTSSSRSAGTPSLAVPVATPFMGQLPSAFSNITTENLRISSAFHFNARLDKSPLNTLVLSTDKVMFAVHSQKLLYFSGNNFANLIPPSQDPHIPVAHTITVNEPSDCLNVVLHTFYGLSCDAYRPTYDCIMSAIVALKVYGAYPLTKCLSHNTPLFKTLMAHAESHAVEIYTLASVEGLEDLAVASSSFTLGVDLHHLPNDKIANIRPAYLHRLYSLHSSRLEALKGLLDGNLRSHPARPNCCGDQWRATSQAYHLSCLEVFYASTPSMTTASIETIMNKFTDNIPCPACKAAAQGQVREACSQWTLVKKTI